MALFVTLFLFFSPCLGILLPPILIFLSPSFTSLLFLHLHLHLHLLLFLLLHLHLLLLLLLLLLYLIPCSCSISSFVHAFCKRFGKVLRRLQSEFFAYVGTLCADVRF